MKMFLTMFFLLVSSLVATGSALAQSLESRCRAAARAEIKGPNCRIAVISQDNHPCAVSRNGPELMLLNDKAAQCMKRGGPGR